MYFLSNDCNKKQLPKLKLKMWRSQNFENKLQSKIITVVCEENAYEMKHDEDGTISKSELPRPQSN